MSRYLYSKNDEVYRVIIVARDRHLGTTSDSAYGPYEFLSTAKGVCTQKVKKIAQYFEIVEYRVEKADNWTKVYGEVAP